MKKGLVVVIVIIGLIALFGLVLYVISLPKVDTTPVFFAVNPEEAWCEDPYQTGYDCYCACMDLFQDSAFCAGDEMCKGTCDWLFDDEEGLCEVDPDEQLTVWLQCTNAIDDAIEDNCGFNNAKRYVK